MAEALTYDSLVSDIQTYAERDDDPFVSQIPRFVMMCENRLASECRSLGMQSYVTGTFSGATLAKPERWRETVSINTTIAGERVFLQQRSYDYCRAYNPDSSVTGTPRYYSDYGYEHYLIVPTPAAAYEFELAYYERIEPLSAVNQTNWFTQYVPQLLLFGSLLEAQPFLKRPELLQQYQALYDRALQGVAQETARRINSDRASTTRTGE